MSDWCVDAQLAEQNSELKLLNGHLASWYSSISFNTVKSLILESYIAIWTAGSELGTPFSIRVILRKAYLHAICGFSHACRA